MFGVALVRAINDGEAVRVGEEDAGVVKGVAVLNRATGKVEWRFQW